MARGHIPGNARQYEDSMTEARHKADVSGLLTVPGISLTESGGYLSSG